MSKTLRAEICSEPITVQSAGIPGRNYYGWPSVAKTGDGKIVVSSSGFRLGHVCPFGKAVISYSKDNGNTYTDPRPVIDTVLDDRDSGLTAFGKSGLIVTSFNNLVSFQRNYNKSNKDVADYLDSVDPEEEKKYNGSLFRVSFDNGETFSEIYHSPVTSPHGPTELSDGRILWIGRLFNNYEEHIEGNQIKCTIIDTESGDCEITSSIPDVYEEDGLVAFHEPHAIQLPTGRIICHIRAEGNGRFTTYQSVSDDMGETWSEPRLLLTRHGGAPAHLLLLSNGILISTYGYRDKPYGIRFMYSEDMGETWSTDNILTDNNVDSDLGYPCSVELDDGTILTVYYTHITEDGPAVIQQIKWKLTDK